MNWHLIVDVQTWWQRIQFQEERAMRPVMSVLVMAMPVAAQANDGPLVCPEGTQWKSGYHAKSKTRFEWCVDSNGTKEGPFRARNEAGYVVSDGYRHNGQSDGEHHLYDAKGRLLMTYVYENGKEVSSQISDQALSDRFRELNREARAEGMHWRISLAEGRAVHYDVTLQFPWNLLHADEAELRSALASNAQFCAIFNIPSANIQRVQARYVNEHGEVVVVTEIPAQACSHATD